VKKMPKQEYTAEFKEQAVKRGKEAGVGVAARELGLVEQTLRNWVKAAAAGKLTASGAKPVTPEQMELSRLRAEKVLGVSISGWRAWRRVGKPDRSRLSDPQAVALIKSIHAQVRAAYGSRRMHAELQARGHRIGIERIEREHGIRARHKRRFKATTDSKHSMPVATSRPRRPTASGQATSPTSPPARAGCTWPSCWTCSTARSWAGRSSRA
jgi:transposase-like protein